MKVQHIIGADISKNSIDLACQQSKTHLAISNSITGFRQMLRWLKVQHIEVDAVMLVMERTGFYSYALEKFLHAHQICFTKVSSLAIKHSLGLVRAKMTRSMPNASHAMAMRK